MSNNTEMNYVDGLVSVVIPTYRRFDTLSRAIRSVQYQTYKPIEILVVDDNEPGDEYSIGVKELIARMRLPNLMLVTQDRHINGAAARNAGIIRAKGEYIAFLDDDDMWLPEKIEREVRFLSGLPDNVGGVSNRKLFIKDGKIDHISEVWKADKKENFKVISKQINIQTCTLLLRRRCLDETGYFDPSLRRHQEVQLMACFTSKYKVEFLNEILTIIDSDDVQNRPTAKQLRDFKNAYFKSIDPVLTKYNDSKRKIAVAHNMTEVAYAVYRDEGKVKGMIMLLKCLIYPSVFLSFIKRLMLKTKNKKFGDVITTDIQMRIYKFIKECEE